MKMETNCCTLVEQKLVISHGVAVGKARTVRRRRGMFAPNQGSVEQAQRLCTSVDARTLHRLWQAQLVGRRYGSEGRYSM